MASRTLTIDIVGDPSSVSRAFRKVGDDADRTGKRVHGFATVSSKGFGRVGAAATGMGALATGAVGLMAKSIITAASDINESLSKNQTLFGKHAEDVERFSDRSAKAFGVSKQAALEYTGVFGNLFRGMDFSRKESAKFSTDLTKLAADMASFNNTSVEDALEALRSGLVGESEPLRRFGVNLNDASMKAILLKRGIIDNTKEALTPHQKAVAAMALTYKQTDAAQGDFKRTQDGVANQTKILKARIADMGAELGNKLLPYVKDGVTWLNKFFDEMKSGKGDGGRFVEILKDIGRKLVDVFEAGKDVAGWLKDHRTLVEQAVGAWAAFKTIQIGSKWLDTIRRALGRGVGVATAEGAAAGRAYGAAFNASSAGSAKGMIKPGSSWMVALKRAGPVAAALLTAEVAAAIIPGDNSLTGDVDGDGVKNNVAGKSPAGFRDTPAGRQQQARSQAAQPGRGGPGLNTAGGLVGGFVNAPAFEKVAKAEKNLADLRRSGKASVREIEHAENRLEAARGKLQSASLKLGESETAGTRKRDKSSDSSDRSKRSADELIKSRRREISAIDGQINELAKHGGATDGTRRKVERLRDRQKELRDELGRLKSKSIAVKVRLDFDTAMNNSPGSDAAQGDGLGITGRVKAGVKANASRLFAKAFPMGAPFSGGLDGADADLGPFAAIGARFGLGVSSGIRPGDITSSGNVSYHSSGDAIDLSGSPGGMMSTFQFLRAAFGSRLRELIYTPGGVGIKDGRPFTYSGKVAADHFDHVHVAYTGPSGDGHGRRPGTGDGIGDIRALWTRVGGSPGAQNMAAAIAMAESTGDPKASHRNADGSIDRGLWQINSVHGALSTFDRVGNARAAVSISGNGRNWNPWTVFKTGAYKRFLSSSGGAPGAGGGGGGTAGTLVGTAGGSTAGGPFTFGNQGTFGKKPVLVGLPGGIGVDSDPFANVPSGTDFIDAQAAEAALTPGTEDDRAAAAQLVDFWEKALVRARGTADPRDNTAAAQGLKGALDALEGLTKATEEANRLQQQRDDLQREQVDSQRKILQLAQQGPAILAAVVAAVNGDIGGRVGLGFSTPGYAGAPARY